MMSLMGRRRFITASSAYAASAAAFVTPDAHASVTGRKRNLFAGTTAIRLATRMVRGQNESPAETVRRIRSAGYTAVNTQPSQWSASERVELRAALAEHDVVIFEVGAYCNIIHPDVAERNKNIANVIQKFEDSESAGGLMVATVSGCCDPKYLINPHPDNWSPETWKILVASVKRILSATSGMKTCLGMEAQITTNIDGPKSHRRLIDDVGDDRCRVNFDPTNMVSFATYFRTTELLDECFDLLGENIMGCHAKDTFIIPDVQTVHVQEVCPGKGVMDYDTFLVRMSGLSWPRALFPEHLKPEEFPEADAYIKKVAARNNIKIHGGI